MRLAAYTGASVALATGVFIKALHQRANFYSACVYLSQSSANLMILTNVCLLAVGFLLFWLQRLLYGPLRPIETEQLYEKAWFAVTETCLAMTIFRGELGGWFLVMFVCLLVGKVWGWIGEGRVEFLEQQPPANPRLFHTRLAISLLLSVLFNSFMLKYCVRTVLEQARPDMMVMFGFEFAVLTILSSSTAARYSISLVEIYVTHQQLKAKIEERRQEIRAARQEAIRQSAQAGDASPPTNLPDENDINEMELDVPGWEEKGRWVFYLDLLTDFLKLTVYLTFFAILFTFYGLPIHILRDVVVTIRSFGRRIMDFLRYRNATRDMNERYLDATAEEVAREEVCIICREEMTHWQQPADGDAQPRARVSDRLRPKKLPCGHILHFACLRSWLERQQNCPTCRRPVLVPPPHRGHPGAGVNGGQGNGAMGGLQGNPAGNQPPGGNGPADGPRARVYQFGPFRIGFGAGRGDLFHNLHQQIHQGNAPLQPANNGNPGARQIGFGFGFGRRAPAAATQATPIPTPTADSDMQGQLQQMEQQIMQEISNLRVTADQLQMVRLLQSELQRLRSLQSSQTSPLDLSNSLSHLSSIPLSSTTIMARQQFVADPRAQTLAAGDTRLPEGLSLPQGWSLVPLHSAAQGSNESTNVTPTLTAPAPVPLAQTSDNHFESQTSASGESVLSESEGAQAPPTQAGSQGLPNWRPAVTPTSAIDDTEPMSEQWTEVNTGAQPEYSISPSTGTTEDVHHRDDGVTESGSSSSPSKGKARMVSVEDVIDDET
ncbi:E3 ubiquitin-protein ligase hrd1 [Aspergillus hancockii]|nr:E3 ubiquitin-protein ligase hrd1 [Aspergillus hancockii]